MTGENSAVYCPHNKRGLNGDDFTDASRKCVLTGGPDADMKGWGYDSCDFAGDDYRKCLKYTARVQQDMDLRQQEFKFHR